MFAMPPAYKVRQNENFRTIYFTIAENLIIQILLKITIESFLCVLINRIKNRTL